MIDELRRRLYILNNKKVPAMSARMLRGGMQHRVNRQEIGRFAKEIETKKKNIKNKIASLEQPISFNSFSAMSTTSTPSSTVETLDHFDEPTLKKIRNVGGFLR